MIGTYYHMADTWHEVLKRQAAKLRRYPGTDNGKEDGKPVLWSVETLLAKRREFGPYNFACQVLLDPVADENQQFKLEWARYYTGCLDLQSMNLYLLVDPANEKKKNNDYTTMLVIGLAADNNYYIVAAIRDRLNLVERTRKLFSMMRQYNIRAVGYEQYGMQADIQHIKYVQEQQNYRFTIIPLGGATPKRDRIKKLIPVFENGRLWLPERLLFKDCDQKTRDFVQEFLDDELTTFPVGAHEDILDDMARVLDPDFPAVFPRIDDVDRQLSINGGVAPESKTTVHKYDVLAPRRRLEERETANATNL
jgi:predicted phage terminase large subunit-like protein